MESEYRKILLLNGLDQITEEELKRFKFLVTDKFGIPRSKLEEATNRTELADQLIQSTTNPSSALKKTIGLFLELNYRNAANSLQEAKKTADIRSKKKGSQQVEKKSQAENCSGASAASRDKAIKKHSAADVCPQAKPQKKQIVAEQEAIREGLQKDPLAVLVLKAIDPFECETQEGKQEIFHATVATETTYFFVKVLNAQFKDKFIPNVTIKISNYLWHSNFLEVTSSSIVVEVDSDHKVCVPNNIRDKAGRTPKISKLKTQPCGTIVNGMFKVQKIIQQRKDRVIYGVYDNTGEMDVVVLGNQSKTKFEEGDKLRLSFFEVSENREEKQLKSGPYSFFKVIKATKPKTETKSAC
ncbi:interferon-inducible protein AIM2 [Peromyscus californicus insignis]|uniref:interferon-inducible protein AIM2 n=1 Tax=Peromyscus californicus insignis TaxID=564181 RepID=UPI0022A73179|nr:interferon-inducible protein AIM2 [Peromyscus californicus insignis]XP_052593649.1 interferon-inducible protein AIM2 [Peromyscus californicus insignis]XP_052593650.1 interferon-inducible protein AIM2 [Peromyscus californicus insignis]XP_052593651.1 interferon-inducible protein AIM2 [Peromyscus californicus insignis]XP_052593652.1 interferon-inducible protein AIM2 [Peromyscus californicus insignis]XP_052593653.1 interferon-inducible protein AIM2 [Peromyscus californicus insignis]